MDINLEKSLLYFKDKFGSNCRILENIGDFRYIINLSSQTHKGNIKFQITDSNKVTFIVSGFGGYDEYIMEQWETKTYSLISIVEKLIELITDNPEDISPITNHNHKKIKSAKNKTDTDKMPKIKLKMKTAEDVIKRIVWDDDLHPMDFTIGYLDRFIGLVEKNFSAFSWEDLASVDYTVLAIPQHRIQYFSYKGIKVWDKTIKLDNVFGSTGSGITIRDIVAENQVVEKPIDNQNTINANINQTVNNLYHKSSDDDNTDSDDDEIQIELDSKEVGISSLHYNEVYFKTRPNYFLCQRITNPEIRSNFSKIQQKLLQQNPLYEQYFIKPEMLHLTLCTLGLYTDEQVQHVKKILEDNQQELNAIVGSGIDFTLSGVGQFIERVIYAKVEAEAKFLDFVNAIKLMIIEAGLNIKDNYDFVPHVTIMKLKFDRFRTAEIQTIPKEHYLEHRNFYFGQEVINGVHLCSMTHERDESGFYLTPAYIILPGISNSEL